MKTRRAFTLVELLVVISIIALLVSILLPALNKAREQAKFLKCKTNQRSIGLAEMNYAADNNNRLTPGDVWNGTTVHVGLAPLPRNMGHLLASGALAVPSSEDHVFFCPGDRKNRFREEAPTSTPRAFQLYDGTWQWGRSSLIDFGYEYRDSMDGGLMLGDTVPAQSNPDNLPFFKGVSQDKISKHSIMTDFLANAYTVAPKPWGSQHTYQYNVLFGDGSVQVVDDRGKEENAPEPDIRIGGLTNWILDWPFSGAEVIQDHVAFDGIDALFGYPELDIPRIVVSGGLKLADEQFISGRGSPARMPWRN